MPDVVDSFEAVVRIGAEKGVDFVVDGFLRLRGSIEQRRRAALFIGGLRGHRMDDSDLREQPYGYVGQCTRCGQIIKVPRVLADNEQPVQGLGVKHDCPSRKGNDHGCTSDRR